MWMMLFERRVPPKARDAYRKDTTAGMLTAVMNGLSMPFVAVIARKTLDANAFEIAILTMAPVAGNLLALVWANIMEGRPKMPFAKWAMIAGRTLLLACAFAVKSWQLVGIVAAMFFVSSVAVPAYSALMKEIYPDGERAKIMAYVRTVVVGIYVVTIAIAAPLLHGHHYRFLFPVAGLFGIAGAFVFGKIPAAEASGDRSVRFHTFIHNGVLVLRDNQGFRWFCAGMFVFVFANAMIQPAYVIHQVRIGVGTDWAGVYSIIAASIMTVGYFCWGGIIDRKSPPGWLAWQTLCWVVIPLVYCVAFRPWMLLPTCLVSGILVAGIELVFLNGVLHFAPTERITHYQAVFSTVMAVAGLTGPLVGAAMVQSRILPMKVMFLVTGLAMASSSLISTVGMRRYDRPNPAENRAPDAAAEPTRRG
ncbi:MAG: hypothetical protein A2Z18_00490 [Armatimonadetes bacterium RBG_16_58_9]|nr:MAG: hypothetical protein A2Z18_00490 [Armatimonadetes bacterium RBG_16_58_9]